MGHGPGVYTYTQVLTQTGVSGSRPPTTRPRLTRAEGDALTPALGRLLDWYATVMLPVANDNGPVAFVPPLSVSSRR